MPHPQLITSASIFQWVVIISEIINCMDGKKWNECARVTWNPKKGRKKTEEKSVLEQTVSFLDQLGSSLMYSYILLWQ